MTDFSSNGLNIIGMSSPKEGVKEDVEDKEKTLSIPKPSLEAEVNVQNSVGANPVKGVTDGERVSGKYSASVETQTEDNSPNIKPPETERADRDEGEVNFTRGGNWWQNLSDSVEQFVHLYRSSFWIIMSTVSISAGIGAVVGALVATFVPQYFPLQNSTQATIQPPSCQTQQDFSPEIKYLKQELEQCTEFQKADEDKYQNLQSVVSKLTSSLETLQVNVSSGQAETMNNYTKLTDSAMLKNYVVDEQMTELKNVFLSREWIVFIILMGLLEMVVVGVVWKMWQKLTETLRDTIRGRGRNQPNHNGAAVQANDPDMIYGDRRILQQVTKTDLDDRVCVISFHTETFTTYGSKIKGILAGNEATKHLSPVNKFKACIISKHEDIMVVIRCKLYVVIVDFNERNLILEDPNKGLGDLRLTTVQALDKMGADVILVYAGHRGSGNLPEGALYNPDLTSIGQHPELKRLDRKRRVLSILREFNNTQIDHIVQVVQDVVK